mgnify:CR=1 FL=1
MAWAANLRRGDVPRPRLAPVKVARAFAKAVEVIAAIGRAERHLEALERHIMWTAVGRLRLALLPLAAVLLVVGGLDDECRSCPRLRLAGRLGVGLLHGCEHLLGEGSHRDWHPRRSHGSCGGARGGSSRSTARGNGSGKRSGMAPSEDRGHPTSASQATVPRMRRCALSERSRRTSGTTSAPRSGSQVVSFACARAAV